MLTPLVITVLPVSFGFSLVSKALLWITVNIQYAVSCCLFRIPTRVHNVLKSVQLHFVCKNLFKCNFVSSFEIFMCNLYCLEQSLFEKIFLWMNEWQMYRKTVHSIWVRPYWSFILWAASILRGTSKACAYPQQLNIAVWQTMFWLLIKMERQKLLLQMLLLSRRIINVEWTESNGQKNQRWRRR